MIRPLVMLLALAAAVLLGLPLLWIAAGALLPAERVQAHAAFLPAAPQDVWSLLTDFPAQTRWRTGLRRVEKRALNLWFEQLEGGVGQTYEITEELAPRRLVRRLAGPPPSIQGEWVFELAPEGAGCRITITRRVRIPNPALRLAVRLFSGSSDPAQVFLDDLRRALK